MQESRTAKEVTRAWSFFLIFMYISFKRTSTYVEVVFLLQQHMVCIIENLMDKPSIKKLWYIPT